MKNLMLILIITIPIGLWSQVQVKPQGKYNSGIQISSEHNIKRYGIDYELVNYTFLNGDSTILLSLDLDYAESFRLENEDVIYHNTSLDLYLLLYKKERIITNFEDNKTH